MDSTDVKWVCAGGQSLGGAAASHRVEIPRSESPPSFRRKREKKDGAPVSLFQLFSAPRLTYGFAACCFSRVMIGA